MYTREKILDLLKLLESKLGRKKIVGEVYLVGGAVMCLSFAARPATKDIDAYFVPKEVVRKAAEDLARELDIDSKWLNDAVKGFFGEHAAFDDYLDLPYLKIFVAKPEYLLAMKCLAMRLGPEFHDEDDVRYLLRFLNIERYKEAVKIISEYYPLKQYPQKTLYALEEILEK